MLTQSCKDESNPTEQLTTFRNLEQILKCVSLSSQVRTVTELKLSKNFTESLRIPQHTS